MEENAFVVENLMICFYLLTILTIMEINIGNYYLLKQRAVLIFILGLKEIISQMIYVFYVLTAIVAVENSVLVYTKAN